MENKTIQASAPKEQEIQQSADKQAIKIKINKKTAITVAVVIVLCVLIYASRGLFIAAIVDGSPISRLTVISKLEKASGGNLLDSIITEKLVKNEAKAKKIVVSEDEVNGEIKKIEEQIALQGGTINEALAGQGMSLSDLKTQIILQLELEKLVADKTNITDEELAQYVIDNKISIPVGEEATTTVQIKEEMKNQKIGQEADALITALKSKAKINYFVNY